MVFDNNNPTTVSLDSEPPLLDSVEMLRAMSCNRRHQDAQNQMVQTQRSHDECAWRATQRARSKLAL